MKPLDPSEQFASRLLEQLQDDVRVSRHDDGSEDGMYDFELSGAIDAAAEVTRVTDQNSIEIAVFWERKFSDPRRRPSLTRFWPFIVGELPGPPGGPKRYPRFPRDVDAQVERALVGLESRGVIQIGDIEDYLLVGSGSAFTISDPDVATLHSLFGDDIWYMQSLVLDAAEPGGWMIGLGMGQVGSLDPDDVATDVETLLADAERADVRAKLAVSGHAVRIAVLVFDTSTPTGYSLEGWAADAVPRRPVVLPPEVTQVVVAHRAGPCAVYDDIDGWRRLALAEIE